MQSRNKQRKCAWQRKRNHTNNNWKTEILQTTKPKFWDNIQTQDEGEYVHPQFIREHSSNSKGNTRWELCSNTQSNSNTHSKTVLAKAVLQHLHCQCGCVGFRNPVTVWKTTCNILECRNFSQCPRDLQKNSSRSWKASMKHPPPYQSMHSSRRKNKTTALRTHRHELLE